MLAYYNYIIKKLDSDRRGMMSEVIIYSTRTCPYCVKAKALLNKKQVTYTEIDVSDNALLREEMTKKAGGRKTVPQIFINQKHIGGCDDLYALDNAGKLDPLLQTMNI